MNFSRWMDEVDRCLYGLVGCSYMDLPDQPYRDAFDDGWDAGDYAAEVMDQMLSDEF